MKKILMVVLACLAISLAYADELPNLPNPPQSDGLSQRDVSVFIDKYLLKDKAWKKVKDESGARALARKFREEHMVLQRHLDKLYVQRDFAGHTVYGKPAKLCASASWRLGDVEGQAIDAARADGGEIGLEQYPFYDDAQEVSRQIKDKDQWALSAIVSVEYDVAGLDFLGEQADDIYPDQTGSFTVMATDELRLYAMDGYTLDIESMNEDVFKVLTPTVETGKNGKAEVKLRGIKPGKAQMKVSVNYHSEYYKRDLREERLFDIHVGARTYEYMVDVTDDLKGRIQYTLSGRFSVWKDNGTKERKCSSSITTISWAPGLDSLVNVSRIEPRAGKNGIIEIVFGDFANPDMGARDVIGDVHSGVKEEAKDFLTIIQGGSVNPAPQYIPPMALTMPVEEGTFNYKLEANEKGELNLDEEPLFGVSPNMYVLTSSFGSIASKVKAGQTVFFTATATIREVSDEE